MPGKTTGDNKFGITSHIVGTTLGDGCNYVLIQDAINDIQAAGGIGTIYIRPGTYTEDLSFISSGAPLHIDIVGASTDGRIPVPLSTVNLIGSHTLGGDNLTIAFIQDIALEATVGDAFTINPTGGQTILALQECSLINNVGRGAVLNPSGGAIAQFSTQDAQTNTQLACAETLSDSCIITSIRGTYQSNTASAFILGATVTALIDGSQISSADKGFEVSPTSNILITNAIVNTPNACYAMPLIGGSCQAYGCIHTSNDPSGYFITGDSSFTYCNITQTGTAIGIDPLMTQIINDWKPYAIEAPSPGTGYSRGTALFNEDHFDVVDGFVSMASTMPYYSLTPYIVGPDVHSEFSTIQAAINQAIADGASSINQKNIHVKPTPLTYVENLIMGDGINIIGLPSSTSYSNFAGGLEPLPVRLQGTVTFPTGISRLSGLSIDSGLDNTFLVGDCTAIINNCMVNQASGPAYLIECTGTAPQVLFEGTSTYAQANFLCTALGTSVSINLEDSYLLGDTAPSQLTDNSSALIEMNYSKWYGAINGGAGTSGAFRAHYSQISDASGVALITAENASLIGTYCLFEAGSTFLLDSTTIGNFEMHHSSFSPFAFTATQANINQIVMEQCTVLQVPTVGVTEIFRPTPGNSFRGTYTQRFLANIQTTDDTPTAILTIPLLDPETVAVFGEVIAFDATFNGALSGPVNGSARRNGGAAVFVADQSSPAQEGTLGAATFQCAVSGNDLIVQVTGLIGVTINWSADFKVLHLQTDA